MSYKPLCGCFLSYPYVPATSVTAANSSDMNDLPCTTFSTTTEISLLPVLTPTGAIACAEVSPSALETIEIEVRT